MGSRTNGRKKQQYEPVVLEEDVLSIDCRTCPYVPEMRSSECVRCVVHWISECGNPERIRLRTSRDLEISGTAAEILCDMASLDRSISLPGPATGRSCSGCPYTYQRIIDIAWQGFPDPFFESARNALMMFRAEDPECTNCIQKSYRALDQAEINLKNIRNKVRKSIARGGY